MAVIRKPLAFPRQWPSEYIRLDAEPIFNPARHLQLEKPQVITTLADLGYDATTCAKMPSSVGITSAFRVLSDEGLARLYETAKRMESNKNEAQATGVNRLGSYIRGAGYRSQFVRDMFACHEIADFLSDLVGVQVGIHSLPSIACGINFAPDDITKAVDNWHVDSMSFDIVMLLVNPTTLKGGEFQYFRGTKQEGEVLLGIAGERGSTNELPAERVTTVTFPAAGYGFLQHGNMVFHRACRLLEKAERITCIPSFVILDSGRSDGTNVNSLMNWADPGMLAELARHEAWVSTSHLQNLIDEISLQASAAEIADQLEAAVQELNAYAAKLRQRAVQ